MLYPLGIWAIRVEEMEIIVTNWIFFAMSLPQFLLWLFMIGMWIWFGFKDARKPFIVSCWRVLLLGFAWLASVVVLLLGSFFLDLRPSMLRASQAVSFDEEPWRTRVIEAAEYDRTRPGISMDRVEYPVLPNPIDIGLALSSAIYSGDKREEVEKFLRGLRALDRDGWTVYAIPIGYFRYYKVIEVQYKDGKVVTHGIPSYFSNHLT